MDMQNNNNKSDTKTVSEISNKPDEMYCLKCKHSKPVRDVNLSKTEFNSRKNGKPMTRETWVGICTVCGKEVRSFAKKTN